MLRKYKNRLLSIIQESGFDPARFSGNEVPALPKSDTSSGFMIRLKDSPLMFALYDLNSNYHQFIVHAVSHTPEYKEHAGGATGGSEWAEREFKYWLERDVKGYLEEVALPDLWSQIENPAQLNLEAPATEQDYLQFSEHERIQIRSGIISFEGSVIERFNPAAEQLAYMQQQLKYLSDSVDRLNRFDWRALALSIVLGIAINLTVDTEGGRLLFQLFDQAMQAATHLLR